jgi:hypothetical protein
MTKSSLLTWLRRYFIAVGLAVLCCAGWKYSLFVHVLQHGGWNSLQTWESVLDSGAYLLGLVLLLSPWWELGGVVTALGYAIILPFCAYVLGGFLVVDLAYVHQQRLFHLFLLSGLAAQILWLFIPLAAKIRESEVAEACKALLHEAHHDALNLVEEFIVEIEGAGKDRDLSQWIWFAGAGFNTAKIPERLEREFQKWLDERQTSQPSVVERRENVACI